MIASDSNHQKDSAKQPEFTTSSNEKTGRPSFKQPRWKLAGIDQEGAHHVLQTDDDIIYAIQNGTVVAREELGDWRNGRTITHWRAYVADKRGWDTWFLQIVDFSGVFSGGEQ